ncbi:MAG: ACP S-malonyltransferase [Rickettsiales bacterium]|nr:ACP S-malonyltransferase [Rickettsiales bacterium]
MGIAFVFPGQGSQIVGMGKAFYDNFPVAREVFQEVDDALAQHLSKIIFEGPDSDLTATENTQPAIMATSIAILRTLEKEGGITLKSKARLVAGHSLGEYTALCAAQAISLSDTARLLKTRGQAMQAAVPQGVGMMAAIIGPEIAVIEQIIREVSEGDERCEIANDNAPGQVVISGTRAAVERAMVLAKEKRAKRAIELNVSAPFHCSLIAPAADIMREALAKVEIRRPIVPVLANITASAAMEPDQIRDLLVQQVTGRVRWRETILKMHVLAIDETWEIGPGKVLCGLNKRITPTLTCHAINEVADIETMVKAA